MAKQLGPRKNLSKLTDKERELFREAIIALNKNPILRFPGGRDDKPFVGGVSYWFKQEGKTKYKVLIMSDSDRLCPLL